MDLVKDLHSKKDMNLVITFNIDCMKVCYVGQEQVRLPIVQFVDDAHALINGGNFDRFNILKAYCLRFF